MTDDWDGTERRAADKRFAAAMTDVRDLKIGITDLAEAVQIRSIELQRVVRQVALLLAGLLFILVIFSLWEVGRINGRLDAGHKAITCLLLVEPAQRTAQSLIECQR